VYINFAIDGGQRMKKMIDNLLELSRIGRENAVKEVADLHDIVREVEDNILKLREDNGARIIIQSALPSLPVHRSDIIHLFQNLLSNAIKFRKKDVAPVISIDAKEEEEGWLFRVADNGIGMAPDESEKIFEIFTRLHGRDSYEGAGIGLAICKKVVQHHGGTIRVESEEGLGSTFYFTLLKG
jgi:signal transduction histidine kinase